MVPVVDAQVAQLAGREEVAVAHVLGCVVEVGGGEDHGRPHWPMHSRRPPARSNRMRVLILGQSGG
ncbi:hypothetical protein GCM10027168_44690 [Streptomyces capparidis]